MRAAVHFLAAAAAAFLIAAPARAEWKPAEKIETYTVTGQTGLELYRSIGENGPQVGVGRVVAYTTFDLKWSRDYRPQADGACKLVKARPHLTIIYKLPRAGGTLPPATKAAWDTFIAGIAEHERVHGAFVLDMVLKIEAFSVGLSAENDPGCKKVRAVLQKRLGELSQEQRAKGRDFDKTEMSDGGNVHRLILALVNGG